MASNTVAFSSSSSSLLQVVVKSSKKRSPLRGKTCVAMAGKPFEVPKKYTKVQPMGGRVLIKIAETERETKGGVLLTEGSQQKPTSGKSCVDVLYGNFCVFSLSLLCLSYVFRRRRRLFPLRILSADILLLLLGDVEAIGDDVHGVKPGQTVLYNKFGIGADDMILNKEEFTMLRELDLIGTFPRSNASVDDIPNLEPLGDRLILTLKDAEMQTKGGILLTSGSQEKPVQGTVSKVGPGAWDEEKKALKPMNVKVGQEVVYFKYAGDQMQDGEGKKYVVLHESDVLAVLD